MITLSPSGINEYLKCGELYRLARIERVTAPVGSSPAAVRGKSLHRGAEIDLAHVAERLKAGDEREGCDLPLEAVQTAAVEEFERAEAGIDLYQQEDGTVKTIEGPPPDWKGHDESPGPSKDAVAQDMIPRWYADIAPQRHPIAVEQWGNIALEGDGVSVILRARLDELPADGNIRDLKHSKKGFGWNYVTDEEAQADLQLSVQDVIYRRLMGFAPQSVGFSTLKLDKNLKVVDIAEPTSPPRTDEQLDRFFELVERVARGIQAGTFLPAAQGVWWCSKKWCRYYTVCRFAQ